MRTNAGHPQSIKRKILAEVFEELRHEKIIYNGREYPLKAVMALMLVVTSERTYRIIVHPKSWKRRNRQHK